MSAVTPFRADHRFSFQPEQSMKLLVVDDDPFCLAEQAELFGNFGLPCALASTAPEALAVIDDDPDINVVITDLVMPGHDGLWLLQQIKERRDAGRTIASILLSGKADMPAAIAGIRNNACDLLAKPVNRDDCQQALTRIAAQIIRMQGDDMTRQLERIRQSVSAVAETLKAHHAEAAPANVAPAGLATAKDDSLDCAMLDQLRGAIAARRARVSHFDSSFFADPAWDILLTLMVARAEGRYETVTNLAASTNVPDSTAKRWIRYMTDSGMLVRSDDPHDSRRSLLALSDETARQMRSYLLTLPGNVLPV